jgi:hypothetical protein
MTKAKREGLKVKAVGNFHSWSSVTFLHIGLNFVVDPLCSPVCETTGYLIKTDSLTGTTRTPAAMLFRDFPRPGSVM